MVTRRWRLTVALLGIRSTVAVFMLVAGGVAHATCTTILPRGVPAKSPRRAITTDDLVRLRTLGTPDASSGLYEPSPLAVSPDGRQVAFLLTQADPIANVYCRALVVTATNGKGTPRLIDQGGEPILAKGTWLADLVVPNGAPVLVTPIWSPDGHWIAYLRQEHGVVQLWRVRANGTASAPVTHSATDVQSLAWSADGRKLIYAHHPGEAALDQHITQEGSRGWLYDSRIVPLLSPRPRNLGSAPRVVSTIEPETGLDRIASLDEAARLTSPPNLSAAASNGRRAWLAPSQGTTSARLSFTDRVGRTQVCSFPICDDSAKGLWWDQSGSTLTILRREGWDHGQSALYRWRPGKDRPRRFLTTDDVLLGCVMALDDLLCTRENANTPRQLVRIEPATGTSRPIFDPNPEFRSIALGKVQRLRWRDAAGQEAWGDLVLPPDDYGMQKLPMIVVQYHSVGFLRGGTGDEYPIHPFTAHGFAVLSIEEPAPPPTSQERPKASATGSDVWSERRRILSSLVTGVRLAIATGAVDPRRIGVTGLSDGATTAKFALLNIDLFAAAAISQSTIEPKTVMTYAGTAFADQMRAKGYPTASQDDLAFWAPVSFTLNASRIATPVLMQVSEDEYLGALESFAALREHDAPVELYVFPDEHHVKWQPSHRKAVYDRSIDWFDFWLQSRVDPDPAKADQYDRWRRMQTRLEARTNAVAPPHS